jgi:hypothetical protein
MSRRIVNHGFYNLDQFTNRRIVKCQALYMSRFVESCVVQRWTTHDPPNHEPFEHSCMVDDIGTQLSTTIVVCVCGRGRGVGSVVPWARCMCDTQGRIQTHSQTQRQHLHRPTTTDRQAHSYTHRHKGTHTAQHTDGHLVIHTQATFSHNHQIKPYISTYGAYSDLQIDNITGHLR